VFYVCSAMSAGGLTGNDDPVFVDVEIGRKRCDKAKRAIIGGAGDQRRGIGGIAEPVLDVHNIPTHRSHAQRNQHSAGNKNGDQE